MPQSSSHFSHNPGLPIAPMSVASPLAAMPSFDKNGLDPAQASLNGLQQLISVLDTSLRLPNTPRAFAIYLFGLAIVFTGAFMHVWVAAQIMQAQFTLSQLQNEYSALEQQNGELVFRIAHETSLTRLHSRINSLGYVPVQQREYVFKPEATLASLQSSEAVNDATSSANAAIVNIANANTSNANTVNAATGTVNTGIVNTGNQEVASEQWVSINLGGEFTSWKNFWDSLWLPETQNQSPTTTSQPSSTQSVNNESNFWSVWWKQASDQGEKLLDQFRNQ